MTRILDFVQGHSEIIQKITDSFERGRPGQTYLFVGPAGIGKKYTATGFAQALLCHQSAIGCGKCPSCFRLSSGNHEGLKVIAPQGAGIKMEQAKEVLEFLSLKSLTGNRVIIIDQAQLLNTQAANSLLKTLEEPPEGTFFFLIAPSVAGILPTIRSRSRIVQFKPLTQEILAKKVKAPLWALRAASGSFEKLAQLQEPAELETRHKAVEILKIFIMDDDFIQNDLWRSEVKDRQQAQKIISYWISFVKDAICFQEEQKDKVVNVDQIEIIKVLVDQTRQDLLEMSARAFEVEQALNANRDAQLVFEEFYIRTRRDY